MLVLLADPARRARPARPPTTSGVLLCMSDETLRPSPRTQAQTLVKAAPGRVDAPHPSPPSKSLSGPQTAYWCSWARTRAPGRTQGLARLVSYVLFEGAVEICVCVGSKRAGAPPARPRPPPASGSRMHPARSPPEHSLALLAAPAALSLARAGRAATEPARATPRADDLLPAGSASRYKRAPRLEARSCAAPAHLPW